MNKSTILLIWATLLTAFLLMLYVFYLLIYPIKTIEVLNEPMPVIPQQVKRGEDFSVEVHYIKYVEADIHTDRSIECEDGNLVTLTPINRNFPLGENTIIINHTTIPEKTSLGMCKLVYVVHYKLNPLRTVVNKFETDWFEVIK